jgi:hypothetical protein
MGKFRDRRMQRQAERDVQQFRRTGKATELAKVVLRNEGMDAIWDIREGRGRMKWGQFR